MKQVIPFISQLPKAEQYQWLDKLHKAVPNESFILAEEIPLAQYQACKISIVANPDPVILTSFTNLKWVQSLWAGVEKLIEPARKQGFALSRLIDPQLSQTMAEAVLAWSLYLHRKMPSYRIQQSKQQWLQHDYTPASECRVGILGLGELGRASAQRLLANGFQVSGWSQSQKTIDKVQCFSGQEGLDNLLADCQILVCLLPLTEQTRDMLNRDLFDRLPQNASLINFARGDLLVIDDLLEKLAQDALYHAVLDVFRNEPLNQDSTLWHHSKITILPHIAAATNQQTAVEIVATNLQAYRSNGAAEAAVDLDKGY